MNASTGWFVKVAGAVVLLVGGVAAGYWISDREKREPNGKAAASHEPHAKPERRVLYWHDPMVPGPKFDKPGKSPFMDMELVPVYADESSEGGVVVPSAMSQSLGIRLGKVEPSAASSSLSAVGTVGFDESRLELVQARVEGVVTHLYVKAPLEHVRRGQPLAAVQAPAWIEAQQEYLALLNAESERSQQLRAAARTRLQVLGVPESVIRQIESERRASIATTLVAPIDGVVSELAVREGAAFIAGAPLFRINGLESVWVNAEVPEAQVSAVTMGANVYARPTAWPGVTFKGRTVALLPEVDEQTRTLTVRVSLENPEQKLSPGMFVALNFESPTQEPALMVPSEAVIATGERNVVIAVRDDGSFEVVEVTIGPEQSGKTVILGGLSEGQSIVLSGQFLIDSEASLRSAVNRLETTTAPASTQERAP
jgi:Cu(I)/Ag(I) efflux system membrane fusion protein